MSTADIYGDPGLFQKLYPRLLTAAVLEAISTPPDQAMAPSTLDVSTLLARADRGKPTEERLREGLSAITREDGSGLQFRCMCDKVELHRQSLMK